MFNLRIKFLINNYVFIIIYNIYIYIYLTDFPILISVLIILYII